MVLLEVDLFQLGLIESAVLDKIDKLQKKEMHDLAGMYLTVSAYILKVAEEERNEV